MYKKVIVLLLTLVLVVTSVSCSNLATIQYTTSSAQTEINVIDCPYEAYIGSFITIRAKVSPTNSSTEYELSLKQPVTDSINVKSILFCGKCRADGENLVTWYFQISPDAYPGTTYLSILEYNPNQGAREIFNRNIIIK